MVEINDDIEEVENHLAKKYSLGFKQKYSIVCIASVGLIVLGILISGFFKILVSFSLVYHSFIYIFRKNCGDFI